MVCPLPDSTWTDHGGSERSCGHGYVARALLGDGRDGGLLDPAYRQLARNLINPG